MSENKNHGFLAANHIGWRKFAQIRRMTHSLGDENILPSLTKYFMSNINFIDNKYNCISPDVIVEGNLLSCKGIPQIVMHPSGTLKKIDAARHMFFINNHSDLYQRYRLYKMFKISRKIFFYD